MDSLHMARDILWSQHLKVVLIDAGTGAYEVLKTIADPDGAEERIAQAPDARHYLQKMIEEWLVHPDDVSRYVATLRAVYNGEDIDASLMRRYARRFRYRIGGKYVWTEFAVIVPTGFPKTTKNVLFTISLTEQGADPMPVELLDLANIGLGYHKILKLDLLADTFEVLKLSHDEADTLPASDKLSNWFEMFAASHMIHKDDLGVYKEFTNMDRIKQSFERSRVPQRCKYRRLIDGAYRVVMMELIPSIEYTSENRKVMLYVKELDETTSHSVAVNSYSLKSKHRDTLTGLKDAASLSEDIADIQEKDSMGGVGVLIAELNFLPFMIGLGGKEAGDHMMEDLSNRLTSVFRDSRCYRVSRERLVAVQPEVKSDVFNSWANEVRAHIVADIPPIASVGTAWSDHAESVDDIMSMAERVLEGEKERFKEKFPDRVAVQ